MFYSFFSAEKMHFLLSHTGSVMHSYLTDTLHKRWAKTINGWKHCAHTQYLSAVHQHATQIFMGVSPSHALCRLPLITCTVKTASAWAENMEAAFQFWLWSKDPVISLYRVWDDFKSTIQLLWSVVLIDRYLWETICVPFTFRWHQRHSQ